ncbi:SMP-30/gluconolactonase/LRE family protein [Gordonia sp. ABSL1-1]|uniref:SMP-30/gluconolactonase/LRE family protein n=1 Tax=Gordonia sp. ABSL1-1 TaxID=3053923 RepID=UPI0025748298|nr:SMP-30/gluconolactonase/LRE family protein [Gordonia sp. ABSL1-1]MDL9937430.1 SMP-30/gluconolactonase/LRE family protein [Gordonia sp. ABSL1-1]
MRSHVIALCAGVVAAAGLVTAVGTAPAAAAPVCPGGGAPPRLVGTVPGAALEGLTVDGRGRLYTTDINSGRVFRLNGPGAPAIPIARVPGGSGAGALAWTPAGTLLVGYGADARVIVGDTLRHASIARLNIATRVLRPWVTGLSAANGMDVSARGNIYATNDFGNLIGRVSPTGAVQANWGALPSANGAVLGRDDRWLYVSRTFVAPGVSRISTANPRVVQNLLNLGAGDFPDGLTLDAHGRPVVPLNASGRIIRITAPGRYCVVGAGMPLSSVLSYGRGSQGFSAGRLYRAGFDGRIYEIPGGFDAGATAAFPGR